MQKKKTTRKRSEERKKRLKRDKLQGECESEHAGGAERTSEKGRGKGEKGKERKRAIY